MSELKVNTTVNGGVVTFTIPITITISLGQPVLQPANLQYAFRVGNRTEYVILQSGHNTNHGWFFGCPVCKKNRLQTIHVDAQRNLQAYCNVCQVSSYPPDKIRNEMPKYIQPYELRHQLDYPNDGQP